MTRDQFILSCRLQGSVFRNAYAAAHAVSVFDGETHLRHCIRLDDCIAMVDLGRAEAARRDVEIRKAADAKLSAQSRRDAMARRMGG